MGVVVNVLAAVKAVRVDLNPSCVLKMLSDIVVV
jgi:hypothetical protein